MPAARRESPAFSLQLVGHLVDSSFDASLVLFTAGCTRCAGCADHILSDLDRKRALVGDDVAQMDQAERRIGLHPLDQRAGRETERARGVGFTEAVLESVRPRIV